MSQEQAKQYLLQGITLAKAGDKDQARLYFTNAVKLDPQNETAWIWMSSVARDARERLFCLQNLLQINPQNETALKGIRAMGMDPNQLLRQTQAPQAGASSPSGVTPAPASAAVPKLAADRLGNILPAVEGYIRAYTPIPTSLESVEWSAKKGSRYGEAAALRRQASRYGMAAVGLVVVLGILGFIALTVLGGEDGVIIANATPTNTFTPTFTPTTTPGVTNTPSPEPNQPEATFAPPSGLARGSIYGNPPTPIYPAPPSGLGNDFIRAINEYAIGNYEAAFPVFEARREETNRVQCDPNTYYYQILGLAELGGRSNLRDAKALYEEGFAAGDPCANSAMLYTAACVVDYLQYLENSDITVKVTAESWCDAALAGNADLQPPLTLAYATRARLYALDGNYTSARSTLREGLEIRPADVNLMLVGARIELQSGDLPAALGYINQALYVEPISESALRLRVDAFLDIAAQTGDPQRQLQLYGTAVLWTQEYLLYYPGKPEGYLLLAQARLGEGNINLALDAYDRVIDARASLPELEQPQVQEAYRQRVRLLTSLGRYEEALDDIGALLQLNPDDVTLIEQQGDLAYRLGRYNLAKESLDIVLAANAQAVATATEEAPVAPRLDLELRRLQIITELCEFSDELQCDYGTAIAILTDNFVNQLDEAGALQALAYRAKATYHLTLADSALSNNERQRAYTRALADIDVVLTLQETGLNQYYRGLILEQLEDTAGAVLSYTWVNYWAQFYEYPFAEDAQTRLEALQPSDDSSS